MKYNIKQDGDEYKILDIDNRRIVATCYSSESARFIRNAFEKAARQGVQPTAGTEPVCRCYPTTADHAVWCPVNPDRR
jgi:hypothetical protein